MADKKHEYWNDWNIEIWDPELWASEKRDPEEEICPSVININRDVLKKSASIQEEERKDWIKDIDSLCARINEYPESTLMNSKFGYTMAILRQKAFKDENAAEDLSKVCKAIMGDGRARKTKEKLEELISIIHREIAFFRTILARDAETTVENAIYDYIGENYPDDEDINKDSNYETAYYAYRKIYEGLRAQNMKEEEIFCFFESAANHITDPAVLRHENPCGRLLSFIKTKTWYVTGDDIVQE